MNRQHRPTARKRGTGEASCRRVVVPCAVRCARRSPPPTSLAIAKRTAFSTLALSNATDTDQSRDTHPVIRTVPTAILKFEVERRWLSSRGGQIAGAAVGCQAVTFITSGPAQGTRGPWRWWGTRIAIDCVVSGWWAQMRATRATNCTQDARAGEEVPHCSTRSHTVPTSKYLKYLTAQKG